MFRHLLSIMFISTFCVFYSGAILAQVNVVASIKPLQMIAHAITDGVSEPEVLIPSSQSYHHFVLRPSTVRTMNTADLLVWVGPELETYLADSIRSAPARELQVLALPGLTVHYAHNDTEGGPEILIPEQGQHAGHKHKDSTSIDPHVWLDPGNAVLLATAMVRELAVLDPSNAAVYQANLAVFTGRLAALTSEVSEQLATLRNTEYAVYHNAFQYFESAFGLHHDVVFVESEELQPSVRHMLTVREAVRSRPLACVMEDVTTRDATVQSLLGNKEIRRIKADTTGQNLTSGPMAYIQLITNLAGAFRQCPAP